MHIDRTVFCWETAAGHFICYFTYVYFHSCTYTLTHAKKLYIFYPSCQSRPAVGEHFHPWRHFSPHLVSASQTAGESRVPFKPLGRLFTLQSTVMRVVVVNVTCASSDIQQGHFGLEVLCNWSGKIRKWWLTQERLYLLTLQISIHLTIRM